MSEDMVNDVMQFMMTLHDMEEELVNRVAVMDTLRGVVQDEWIRTGLLVPVEGDEE